MGGAGAVRVSAGNGTASTVIHVNGVPTLYTLFNAPASSAGTMVLHFPPGARVFAFTFG